MENFGCPLKAAEIFHNIVTLTMSWKIPAAGGGGHTGFFLRVAQISNDIVTPHVEVYRQSDRQTDRQTDRRIPIT